MITNMVKNSSSWISSLKRDVLTEDAYQEYWKRTEQMETEADSEIQKDSGLIFLLRRDEIKR